jgi:hypothetical protein
MRLTRPTDNSISPSCPTHDHDIKNNGDEQASKAKNGKNSAKLERREAIFSIVSLQIEIRSDGTE